MIARVCRRLQLIPNASSPHGFAAIHYGTPDVSTAFLAVDITRSSGKKSTKSVRCEKKCSVAETGGVKGVSSFASCGQVLLEMGRNVGVMENAFTFRVLAAM